MDSVEQTFCDVSRDFFWGDFKEHEWELDRGTMTISGGKNSLIQELSKSRNNEYIMKLCSKVESEEEEVRRTRRETLEVELPPHQPPRFDHDLLPHYYPVCLLVD